MEPDTKIDFWNQEMIINKVGHGAALSIRPIRSSSIMQ